MSESLNISEKIENDDIKKRNYDKEAIKKHNHTFFNKNKDKKYLCEICNYEVSYFNKSHHKSSQKHLFKALLLEKN